ncbi:MAG: glycosyltransferase [Candidatus Omnitrophica bacterium]|nr:glycosyltransferase [Candidatus Omnitrophota bacterium]MDD5489025.1 glycosyltransferase [Candidatus Omnitrophota bacterium]
MGAKVSVIIPAYNSAELTVRTVNSVLGQTFRDIEVLVVDDGSGDDTGEKMKAFGGRIRYIRKDNGGASSARNVGIKASTGGYLAFLDCDDIYMPEKIERSVGYLDAHPSCGFVHTSACYIDGEDRPIHIARYRRWKRSGQIADGLLLHNFIINSTVVARRECLEAAGPFDEGIFMPADWDMWLRMAEMGEAGYIDEPLTLYRVTGRYIMKHLELSEKEQLYMLDKAFARRANTSARVRRKALVNVYCRHAAGFMSMGEYDKGGERAGKALSVGPWNPKALLLLAAARLFGRNAALGEFARKTYYGAKSAFKKCMFSGRMTDNEQ